MNPMNYTCVELAQATTELRLSDEVIMLHWLNNFLIKPKTAFLDRLRMM